MLCPDLLQVTKPFSDTSYSAGGSEKPSGGDIDTLAQLVRAGTLGLSPALRGAARFSGTRYVAASPTQICADFQAAGAQLFDQIQAGKCENTLKVSIGLAAGSAHSWTSSPAGLLSPLLLPRR